MKNFWKQAILPKDEPKEDKTVDGIMIKFEKPPIWDSVCAAFAITPSAYFTYGRTIYVVNQPYPPDDIIVHEKVHMRQQEEAGGPALWWGKYLRDSKFRLLQESEAYGEQYKAICKKVKDPNAKFRILQQLSKSLSGPLYKNAVGIIEASGLIKEYSGLK